MIEGFKIVQNMISPLYQKSGNKNELQEKLTRFFVMIL